ncbi:diguanylate cyclase [Paenibacillus aestuarii]|uniref:Diguanylate cyclase n=1 Tax=Paenibacillus aestuarii TaxID=516965 RepID=A0ABW0KIP3_9BACL|nr:diguanylate cyclase [Paenibacillus aestuarii]
MYELLRSKDQHRCAEHFEEFLRHGLCLPAEIADIAQDATQALRILVPAWLNEAGAAMLPPQTGICCWSAELDALESCAGGLGLAQEGLSAFTDELLSRVCRTQSFQCLSGAETGAMLPIEVAGAVIPIKNRHGGVCCGYFALFSTLITQPAELTNLLYTLSIALTGSAQLAAERHKYQQLLKLNQQTERQARKQDVLFEASKKLHAQIDVDAVLNEVIESIHSIYPLIQVDLLLSQDNDSTNLPVKPLSFQNQEDDICTRAFKEGHLIYQPALDVKGTGSTAVSQLAVPLSGKQGVYGVLHLQMEPDVIQASDLQFISLLADTAGTAFENAKLYEQSNSLINELRLINEITKRLNQSLRLNEVFDFASAELLAIFAAEYCSILQIDPGNERLIMQASNLPALYHETYSVYEGYSGQIFTSKEPVIISDYATGSQVTSKFMQISGARSLIGSPIIMNGKVVGVILVAHSSPNYFSYDNFKLLEALSGHIGLAVSNASLHAEVKRMVITDNLTGLYARHYLDEQANLLQKKDFCGSLIVVDIDNFKRVNDTHGHQVGDKILIQVSQIIRSSIRDTDIAARWGGEEIAVYLPQVTKEQTLRIAERIRARVQQETNPQVTVSCGLSDWNWEQDKISVEALFYRADMALYQAKYNGRNQIKVG